MSQLLPDIARDVLDTLLGVVEALLSIAAYVTTSQA